MKQAEDRVADADGAYEMVMDAIVTQRLAPSQKVSENILNAMFGISRTASRNLIERLTAQQFLEVVSPRITRVAPLTLMEVKQNFALRKLLVPEMAALSAVRLKFETLDQYRHEVASLLPIENDDMALALLKANKRLNLAICEKAGFPLMQHWHRHLEDTAMRIYWFYVKTNKSFPYTMEQESLVVEILKSGEPNRIKKYLFERLCQTEERILNAIFSNDQFFTQNLNI